MNKILLLTLDEFQEANKQRANLEYFYPECNIWNEAQWFREFVGEVGEAANILKKVDRGDFYLESEHLEAFKDEVGDTLATFCNWINKVNKDHNTNISIFECGIDKYNKVNEKYKLSHRLELVEYKQMLEIQFENEQIKGLNNE